METTKGSIPVTGLVFDVVVVTVEDDLASHHQHMILRMFFHIIITCRVSNSNSDPFFKQDKMVKEKRGEKHGETSNTASNSFY